MSLHPYRDEELNHFKCLSLVLNEFPKALRQTFKAMWDTTIGHRPGYQLWDDSIAVRNLFVSTEGGTTKVPTHQSYNEWDCTAFFQATIFAKSFSIHSKTLNDLYVKPRAVPYGSFHGSVLSPVGDNTETFALAVDQLRRLRNTVCHSSRLEMDKATFDQNIQYAREAFKALGISTASIDAIGSLTASDFPTTETRKLEQQVRQEMQAYIKYLENRNADLEKIEESLASIKKALDSLTANKEGAAMPEQRVEEHMTSAAEGVMMQQEDISELGKEIHELKKKEEERYKEAEKTGPLLSENLDVREILFEHGRQLTIALSGGDKWKLVAEKLGLNPREISFLDKRVVNPAEALLAYVAEKRGLTVRELCDVLSDCGLFLLADKL